MSNIILPPNSEMPGSSSLPGTVGPSGTLVIVNDQWYHSNGVSWVAMAPSGTGSGTGAQLGTANTDVNRFVALDLETDTRTTNLTFDASGKLTQVTEVDPSSSTTVRTTTLTYTNGLVTQVQEVAGNNTVTSTLNYTNGRVTSVTKTVQ